MTPAQLAKQRRASPLERQLMEYFAARAKPSPEFAQKLAARIRALPPASCNRMRYDGGQH